MWRHLALVAGLLCLPVPDGAASAAERLAAALRIKTISYQDRALIDYAAFRQLNDYLADTYPRVFAELDVELVNEFSLLLRWPGREPDLLPILFTAHTDVVPIEPGTEQDWTYPPFGGVIADGNIHGRGTLDDKVGVLGLLEAVEQLLAEGYSPRRGIVLAFGHDEEISGPEGAAALAARMKALGLRFQWMVDEGGMILTGNPLLPDRPVAMVNVAEKGYLTLTLVATGEGGHSSSPPRISTIGRLSHALARIEANPFDPRLVGPVQAMFETMAPHLDQPQRFVFDNLWLTGSLVANRMAEDRLTLPFVRTTTALTMFNAGVKENVVPQRAEARVNFRLLPGDTAEMVVDYITALIDDPAIEIFHEPWDGVPPVSDHEGPGFRVISEAIGAIYPEALVTPSLLTATTDTRHYVDLADDLYRFHGMMMDASQIGSIHGTNEYIGVESYENTIAVAREMMRLGSR
jgi:carboxypeptidase PM20D1